MPDIRLQRMASVLVHYSLGLKKGDRMALYAGRAIVGNHGLRALATPGVAGVIGYTSGAVYQMFESSDGLVEEIRAERINELGICHERIERLQA